MSTYYQYEDVKIMMAHKLMNMDGWKIYGYKADESDSMTDYYSPASWSGVAEKNGYILCVDVYGASEGQDIKKYTNAGAVDRTIYEKIAKLEEMTTERGATEHEEATAQKRIEALKIKLSEQEEQAKDFVIVDRIPAHMAHPPKMNWHIEKDGVIIAKGNGILKFAHVHSYYVYGHYSEAMQKFKADREKWREDLEQDLILRNAYGTEEQTKKAVESRYNDMLNDEKLIDAFEKFVNKIDVTCGGMIGEGEQTTYKKITVTEYKTELKAVETESGEIKDGQYFIVKSSGFNHGIFKNSVYRIHKQEYNGKIYFNAYKLNGKLTKECHGRATTSNYWYIGEERTEGFKKFLGWIEKGSLSFCKIEEVKTPYEVEKVVKNTVKTSKKANTTEERTTEETDIKNYTFEVSEDIDTRDNTKIYLVKVAEKLSRDEYIKVNNYIKSLGGYYSKFKHAFLFKENPTELLNATQTEANTENIKAETQAEETQTETKKEIKYNITEDKHTKTGQKIWIVKPETQLNKNDFAEVKQKLAILKGFYSTFKNGFIFKYDPSEVLQTG